MRRQVWAALALVSVCGSPALAQYYEGPWGGYEEEDEAPRSYRRGPSPFYDPEDGGPRGFYDRRRRGARLGTVCTTSRGDCRVDPGPISARCRCFIPGFGPKRGAIAY
jgi:hypothetical protein